MKTNTVEVRSQCYRADLRQILEYWNFETISSSSVGYSRATLGYEMSSLTCSSDGDSTGSTEEASDVSASSDEDAWDQNGGYDNRGESFATFATLLLLLLLLLLHFFFRWTKKRLKI